MSRFMQNSCGGAIPGLDNIAELQVEVRLVA